MMRYPDLAEMILLCIVLAVIGVAAFYGARWHWHGTGAKSRVVIRTLVIVASLFACFALGRTLFNWY